MTNFDTFDFHYLDKFENDSDLLLYLQKFNSELDSNLPFGNIRLLSSDIFYTGFFNKSMLSMLLHQHCIFDPPIIDINEHKKYYLSYTFYDSFSTEKQCKRPFEKYYQPHIDNECIICKECIETNSKKINIKSYNPFKIKFVVNNNIYDNIIEVFKNIDFSPEIEHNIYIIFLLDDITNNNNDIFWFLNIYKIFEKYYSKINKELVDLVNIYIDDNVYYYSKKYVSLKLQRYVLSNSNDDSDSD